MRAVEISIFIALIGLGLSVASAVTGYTGVSGDMGVLGETSQETMKESGALSSQSTGWMGKTIEMFGTLTNAIGILYNVIVDAALLGTTINRLLQPYGLPSVLVYGLNGLGTISVTLAMIQFVTGRGFRGME